MSAKTFVLPTGNNNRVVLTTPNVKKSNIVPPVVKEVKVKEVEIATTEKQPIKNLFIGENKDIPVYSFYVDTYGDLIMFAKNDKQFYSETVVAGDFTITDVNPKIANSGNITFLEYVADTTVNTDTEDTDTKVVRTRTTKITGDVINLCEINYGYARKLFIHKSINGINIDDIITYNSNNRVTTEKTYYEGILSCSISNEDMAKDLIGKILKTDKKAFVSWL